MPQNEFPHVPSAFKRSSKFSEDFIFHFPEKSVTFFSMLVQVAEMVLRRLEADCNCGLSGSVPSLLTRFVKPVSPLCPHQRLRWLADSSPGSDAGPANAEGGGREGLWWFLTKCGLHLCRHGERFGYELENALPVRALMLMSSPLGYWTKVLIVFFCFFQSWSHVNPKKKSRS